MMPTQMKGRDSAALRTIGNFLAVVDGLRAEPLHGGVLEDPRPRQIAHAEMIIMSQLQTSKVGSQK